MEYPDISKYPWTLSKLEPNGAGVPRWSAGHFGPRVYLTCDKGTARLIIRAVNAHEALVKAASVLLMHHRIQALDGVSDTLQPRLDALRAALAEAKKGDQ